MSITFSGLAEITRLSGEGLGGTKFNSIAIGTSNTSVDQNQTSLLSEITTGGGARKSTPDVNISLVSRVSNEDTVRFVTTFAFTNSFSINEIGVFNAPSGGTMLLRQTFAAPLNVVSQDSLQLVIDVTSSDAASDPISVLTFSGISEGNKLIGEGLTCCPLRAKRRTKSGRLKSVALGTDDGTVLPLNQTNTSLGNEIVAGDNVGLSRGQESQGPTVIQETVNSTGDTLTVFSTWDVTGTVGVNEAGTFTDVASNQGEMFVRYVFNAPLNLIATDRFIMVMQLVQTAN